MATAHINIPKLNGSNYANWSSDMKYVLMERNLWSIVIESEKLPVGTDNEKEAKEFKSRSNIALSLIYLYVEAEYRRVIEGCDDPVSAWKTLKLHFFPDSRAYHMKLFTELCECRIKPKESIDLYASRILRVADQIQSLDKSFSEIYFSFQLVRFLPACFDSAVQYILRWSKEKFIFKDIVNELVAEEARLKLRETDLSATNKVVVQSVQRNRKNYQAIICHICHKPGHIGRVCRNKYSHGPPSDFNKGYQQFPKGFSRNIYPQYPKNFPKDMNNVRYQGQRGESPDFQFRDSSTIAKKWQNQKSPCYKNTNYNSFSGKESPRKWADFLVEANLCNGQSEGDWIFDTAASHHCCMNRKLFIDYKSLQGEEMAVAVKGVTFPILGKGTIKVKFGQRILYFSNVMHAKDLRRNLISGPKLDAEGISFHGENGIVNAFSNDQLLFKALLVNGIYKINFKSPGPNKKVQFGRLEVSAVDRKSPLEIWHKRCAHVNPSILIQTSKSEGVKGLPSFKDRELSCEACKLSKFRRKSFKPIGKIRSQRPLELLHADVWGPSKIEGQNGERYFLSIIDDFSRKTALYPIQTKAEVFDVVKRHVTRAECYLSCKVKAFRSDNGGEFVNRKFEEFFNEKGIKHELTNVFTPEQNGVIERFNQTVTDGARTLLKESGLDDDHWPNAMLHFVYTWNRLVHRDGKKTPFELYSGNKPSVSHLRPFGCVVYVGIPRQHRSKLEAKAQKGILIGYAFKTRGYRVWFPEENNIVETINVSFDESKYFNDGAVLGSTDDYVQFFPISESDKSEDTVEESRICPSSESRMSSTDEETDSCDESQGSESEDNLPSLKQVKWVRKRVPRQTGKKVDIYYFEEGKTKRLRSEGDVKNYCMQNNLEFNPDLFSFKSNDTKEGLVTDPDGASSSLAETL